MIRFYGNQGDDVYRFAQGDGADVIEDNGNGADRLEISGYSSTDAGLSRLYKAANDLVITFVGGDDSITILNTLDGSSSDTIEEIVFADGVTWTPEQIVTLLGQ